MARRKGKSHFTIEEDGAGVWLHLGRSLIFVEADSCGDELPPSSIGVMAFVVGPDGVPDLDPTHAVAGFVVSPITGEAIDSETAVAMVTQDIGGLPES